MTRRGPWKRSPDRCASPFWGLSVPPAASTERYRRLSADCLRKLG
eukprot:CAMPEP_0174385852 /NCGR_PEP_ID=MMETSP0811_2-20130205/126884_1 /TAXON_ID=73025 ORGANISM="Eutreptiella gymnastica-like, Strain CCMP1594" /NCGR_SAMPLE_ID=MMETSP0811_2 /ASSEMBLY_ACC=CAM_ASM_000667 /LENGTH=44 /DNA_ID= /DNA_START= /DNA_END= /DNA_ORIENTATION=